MLTAKQQRFVEEYLVSLNGTRAAIRAGYSPKTARAIACENLNKPEIAAAVTRGNEARRKQSQTDTRRVLEGLRRIAFSNIQAIFDKDRTIKHPSKWSQEAWDGIKSIRYSEKLAPGPGGKKMRVISRAAIRKNDSLKALDLLGEHLGLFQAPAQQQQRAEFVVLDKDGHAMPGPKNQ